MKRTRKIIASTLALALLLTCFNVFTVSAATGSNKISRVGKATRTVTVGQNFELEVKEGSALDDNDMKWSLNKSGIVKFTDRDRYDDEVDLKAIKKGTVKVTCKNLVTGGKIVYTVIVKEKSNSIYISRIGSATKKVELGDDIDLKVKKGSGLKNSQIKWTISDKSILRFEDGDNIGSEVEVEAKKLGTTKVTVKNLKTGGQLVYTIKVVPDYDD